MNLRLITMIISMALVTFITRIGSQIIFTSIGIPSWLEKWLKHVPTAFLTALIIPAILLPKGYLDISFNNSYLLAGMVAAAIAYKTKNVFTTIIVGMVIMITVNH